MRHIVDGRVPARDIAAPHRVGAALVDDAVVVDAARHRERRAPCDALDELELARAKRLAEIDAKKFADTVAAIGADTIAAIAEAGPATQAKLLQGLGIQSMLITDGTSPVNLFNTANGLVGGSAGGGAGMNMPALGA